MGEGSILNRMKKIQVLFYLEFFQVNKKHILLLLFFVSQVIVFGQEKEDESKMIREIVKLEVDKTKFAPPKPAAEPVVEAKGKKRKEEN